MAFNTPPNNRIPAEHFAKGFVVSRVWPKLSFVIRAFNSPGNRLCNRFIKTVVQPDYSINVFPFYMCGPSVITVEYP